MKHFIRASCRVAAIAIAIAIVIGVGLTGCQRGRPLPPSVGLAGAVTQGGKPLAEGQLTLYPLDKPGGAPVGVDIKDGRYEAPVVPKGKYRVVLSATAAPRQIVSSGDVTAPSNGPPPPIETLPQTVVEIAAPSPQFDIDLKKP